MDFKSLQLNITSTARGGGSALIDARVGGSAAFQAGPAGNIFFSGGFIYIPTMLTVGIGASDIGGVGNTSRFWISNSNGAVARQNLGIHSSNGSGAFEVAAFSGGANIWEQRNSTNAQTFRLYNTYTDASNYERGFFRWNTNVLEIGSEAAGTGTNRILKLQSAAQVDIYAFGTTQAARFSSSSIIYTALAFAGASKAGSPTTTDLAAGRAGVYKDTTAGTVALWYNDGGTMKSVALA